MRSVLLLFGASLLGTASCTPPRPAPVAAAATTPAVPARPIFRWVRVSAGVITLGEPLPRAVAAPSPGDTLVSLPAGSFAGAEHVQVHLAPDGVVRALAFYYVHDASFAGMVAEYESSLGPATRSRQTAPGEEPADVATWRDGLTELRLVRDPNRSAWTVRSTLVDLAPMTRERQQH